MRRSSLVSPHIITEFGRHGNFINAEMVKAFITATEYRERFTRSDALTEAFFEFDSPPRPETMVFKLNDPERIAEARGLVGRSKIVKGTVSKEPVYYNRSLRFHLVPGSIGFPDGTVEVCQTVVKAVQDGLEEVGGAFLPANVMCPGARILREVPPPPR